jgi:beta-phosphoglucomutase family hydrolase
MNQLPFDAVIFDLDGVITQTALVHSTAWKAMFDGYLHQREKEHGEAFREFDHTDDYLPYVDGKPRYKGVESFLLSRSIKIPFGDPSDSPDIETICGLGNRKDRAFNEILVRDGVKVYPSSVRLIEDLQANGIRIGIASSSKNCKIVLEAAGLLQLFETRVDGEVSATLNLKGKPEPDIFTVACANLGSTPDRAIVVEDAVSGVQAGRKGNFGFVLGIAREENHRELLINGADIVVDDLEEVDVNYLKYWFAKGLEDDNWSLTYHDFDPVKERTREALMTVGNGYFGTRGALEEMQANAIDYPGTYIAGLYNRLESKVGDRMVDNEDFVNCPNWLPVSFRIGEGGWLELNPDTLAEIDRKLDFKNGVLYKRAIVRDEKGNETLIESRRLAGMQQPHLAAISYNLTPVNYSAEITLRSILDGDITNGGVERYKQLNQQHLAPVEEAGHGNLSYILVKTTQSDVKIAMASRLKLNLSEGRKAPDFEVATKPARAESTVSLQALQGVTINLEKVVAIYTSFDKGISDELTAAQRDVTLARNFEALLQQNTDAWAKIWDKIDITIEGDRLAQKLLRLHLYHLIVSASPHNVNIDASFTARGLHGEAYRGHIFWDELFILPFYTMQFPETAKATLMYRYHRLEAARDYAREFGYAGAMFPWQSGSDGREETQVIHLNPVSGEWGDDYSSLQRHVSLAIAYDIWEYYHTTGDLGFISEFGAEMFLEICRFWASKSELNPETGRYSIGNVMGPDEFHEQYHGAKDGGIRDNTYTNLMVAWAFDRAFELMDLISENDCKAVKERISLTEEELFHWREIGKKLNIVISPEGILSQYDGYFDLKELDWDGYRAKFGNIYRLDRILKAEGKSADEFKVAKQADTLMIFYNLDPEQVTNMLQNLGYPLPENYLGLNLEYYLARTSHGSTLSRVVHAQLANMTGDKKLSWELYLDALTSDYNDIQGGTTGEGIHSGVMAGTVLIALGTYAGLNLRSEIVKITPSLPEHWRKIGFHFTFRGESYEVEAGKDNVVVKVFSGYRNEVPVEVAGKLYQLGAGLEYVLPIE